MEDGLVAARAARYARYRPRRMADADIERDLLVEAADADREILDAVAHGEHVPPILGGREARELDPNLAAGRLACVRSDRHRRANEIAALGQRERATRRTAVRR